MKPPSIMGQFGTQMGNAINTTKDIAKNPMEALKQTYRGLQGDNGWDLGDFGRIVKGVSGGYGGVANLIGDAYNSVRSPNDIPPVSGDPYKYQNYQNMFAPSEYDMSGMMDFTNTPIQNMFQYPANNSNIFDRYSNYSSGAIPKGGTTSIHDLNMDMSGYKAQPLGNTGSTSSTGAPSYAQPRGLINPTRVPFYMSPTYNPNADSYNTASMSRPKTGIVSAIDAHNAFTRKMDLQPYYGQGMNAGNALEDFKFDLAQRQKNANLQQ